MKLPKLQLRTLKLFSVSNFEKAYYKSPIGILEIIGNDDGITAVTFVENDNLEMTKTHSSAVIDTCIEQLKLYFSNELKVFTLKLNPKGTDFQKIVWTALLEVPYGKIRSYLEQTKTLGDPKAIRAVASANGKNPIAIIIPCHRIIGSDGSLTGYAGKLWRKKWLLEHENDVKQQKLF